MQNVRIYEMPDCKMVLNVIHLVLNWAILLISDIRRIDL